MSEPAKASPFMWFAAIGGGLAALVSMSTLLDQKYASKSDLVEIKTTINIKFDDQGKRIDALIRILEKQEEMRSSRQPSRRTQRPMVLNTIEPFPRVARTEERFSEWP